jgi:hypothetical protein
MLWQPSGTHVECTHTHTHTHTLTRTQTGGGQQGRRGNNGGGAKGAGGATPGLMCARGIGSAHAAGNLTRRCLCGLVCVKGVELTGTELLSRTRFLSTLHPWSASRTLVTNSVPVNSTPLTVCSSARRRESTMSLIKVEMLAWLALVWQVFASKTECFRCRAPKPAGAGLPAGANPGRSAASGTGPSQVREGDWTCPSCKVSVTASDV